MKIKPTHAAASLAFLISAALAAPVMAQGASPANTSPDNSANATQQDTQAFQRWDDNSSGKIDKTEFRTHYDKAGWYAAWDTNKDNRISQDEFNRGQKELAVQSNNNDAFANWDVNDDGFLDNDEFGDGIYTTWDTNHDWGLNDDEYDEGINWFDN